MSIGKDSVKSQWKLIYIGLPYRQLVAIVELEKPENIEDWLEKYSYDEEAVERIKDYLTRNKVAMPIFSFQEIDQLICVGWRKIFLVLECLYHICFWMINQSY